MIAFAKAHPVILTLMVLSVLGTVGYGLAAAGWKARQQ